LGTAEHAVGEIVPGHYLSITGRDLLLSRLRVLDDALAGQLLWPFWLSRIYRWLFRR
jgi:hypothetical protein